MAQHRVPHHLQRHGMQHHDRSQSYRDGRGEEKRYAWADFFIYSTDPVGFTLTAGQSSNRVIQLDADSDFNVMRITGYAEAAGSTFPLSDSQMPQITVNLADGMTSRNLFNNPLPWGALIGSGRLPFVLPQYRVFTKNGTIIIGLANFAAVTYNNIVIALEGVKLFEAGRT